MTTEEIQKRVDDIRAMSGDDESAHSAEDKLRADFIAYVATLPIPIGAKAKLVLSTKDIAFERWCA